MSYPIKQNASPPRRASGAGRWPAAEEAYFTDWDGVVFALSHSAASRPLHNHSRRFFFAVRLGFQIV